MRTRSKLAIITLSTGLALAGFALPAQAALTGDTTATFTITAGALAITVPASATFAAVNTGAATAGGPLGSVSVVDLRGLVVNGWATTVATSAFVTGTSTPAETVPAPSVAYASGTPTAHTGLGTFVAGTIVAPPNYTGAAGISSTTWNPTLTLTLLPQQTAGIYTGLITHSVA